MNKKIELFVSILTLASVIVILVPTVYSLSPPELHAIYSFDMIVVIILGVDFYARLRESGQGSKFLLTHCYEIPAMLPMILFVKPLIITSKSLWLSSKITERYISIKLGCGCALY